MIKKELEEEPLSLATSVMIIVPCLNHSNKTSSNQNRNRSFIIEDKIYLKKIGQVIEASGNAMILDEKLFC